MQTYIADDRTYTCILHTRGEDASETDASVVRARLAKTILAKNSFPHGHHHIVFK